MTKDILLSVKHTPYELLLATLSEHPQLSGEQAIEIVKQHLAGKRVLCRARGDRHNWLRLALNLLRQKISKADVVLILKQRSGLSRQRCHQLTSQAVNMVYQNSTRGVSNA